jgi:hypothetical protein
MAVRAVTVAIRVAAGGPVRLLLLAVPVRAPSHARRGELQPAAHRREHRELSGPRRTAQPRVELRHGTAGILLALRQLEERTLAARRQRQLLQVAPAGADRIVVYSGGRM